MYTYEREYVLIPNEALSARLTHLHVKINAFDANSMSMWLSAPGCMGMDPQIAVLSQCIFGKAYLHSTRILVLHVQTVLTYRDVECSTFEPRAIHTGCPNSRSCSVNGSLLPTFNASSMLPFIFRVYKIFRGLLKRRFGFDMDHGFCWMEYDDSISCNEKGKVISTFDLERNL